MLDTDTDDAAVALFYSYAHEDEALRDELAGHLKILERRGLIRPWHDRRIVAGQQWSEVIDAQIETAELVLLLLTKDFMSSDYIVGVELKRAMQRHAEKACHVVPIKVRPVDIDAEDAEDFPFLKLQGLPTDLRPVTSWGNRDEAWVDVAKGLRATVKRIRAERPQQVNPIPMSRNERVASLTTGAVGPPQTELRSQESATKDIALERIVSTVAGQIDEAEESRSGHAVFDQLRDELLGGIRTLIDQPEERRVLWVDDQPANNRFERATLAKLQIEVVEMRSTDEAMHRIADDARAGQYFDLVLTDWTRPGEKPSGAQALLEALRRAGYAMPVVVYHGDSKHHPSRAKKAHAAGAMGTALLPSKLLQLVREALAPPLMSVRAEIVASGEERMIFTLTGWQERIEVRLQNPPWPLVRALTEAASNSVQDAHVGRTLVELLIGPEIEKVLIGAMGMRLLVDTSTGVVPWELLDIRAPSRSLDQRPWAIRTKLLRTTPPTPSFRARSVDAVRDILVIGEPLVDKSRYPSMPGASAEAEAVVRRLMTGVAGTSPVRVRVAGGNINDAVNIINALHERPYRVLHVVGHYDPDLGTGVVLSENIYLGANEIAAMAVVPELVFVNCGHLAAFGPRTAQASGDHAAFASRFAARLIEIGVRCVVVTGFAVEEVPALNFATTFYDALLAGHNFTDAIADARDAAWGEGRAGNTWAAYQCYGDPRWNLTLTHKSANRPISRAVHEPR